MLILNHYNRWVFDPSPLLCFVGDWLLPLVMFPRWLNGLSTTRTTPHLLKMTRIRRRGQMISNRGIRNFLKWIRELCLNSYWYVCACMHVCVRVCASTRVWQSSLSPTMQAANYLDIKGLLDVTCKTVANMIKGNLAKWWRVLLEGRGLGVFLPP